MCLTEVTSKTTKRKTGYKMMAIVNGEIFTLTKGLKKPIPVGQWIKSSDYRDPISSNYLGPYSERYKTGFHIILDKSAVTDLVSTHYRRFEHLNIPLPPTYSEVIMRVKFRNIIAVGEQDEVTCVVAEEIYLIPSKSGS